MAEGNGGGHQGLYFIVGALVVIVGILGFLYADGHLGGGGGGTTSTEKTTVTVPGVSGSVTTERKD